MNSEEGIPELSFKYSFASPNQEPTGYFDLLIERNLSRIGITQDQIANVVLFVDLPGTLRPEEAFSEHHRTGGSFGVRIVLTDGRSAWLYGRVSYDENINQDHAGGRPHWNFDIQAITANGGSLNPYRDMSWHELPDSEFLDILIMDSTGQITTRRVSRS